MITDSEVICAVISLLGSMFGAVAGITFNTKLSNYRIAKLEEKVDKHNNLIERMYKAETRIDMLDGQLKETAEKFNTLL